MSETVVDPLAGSHELEVQLADSRRVTEEDRYFVWPSDRRVVCSHIVWGASMYWSSQVTEILSSSTGV